MKRCVTCLYPDTKPDLQFNEDGECSACVNFRNRTQTDWDARLEQLTRLLEKHDGRCLVPSSGGKDSTYIALRLKELGADVTAITCRTDYLTPLGRQNIDNLARHVRTIEFTPKIDVRRKLCRLGMEMVGDICWPEHVLIHRIPFRFAADLKVPLMFYGECPNNQYGGPEGTANIKKMTQKWVSEFGGFLGMRAEDFVGQEGITAEDMIDYGPPPKGKCEAHFLGWFEPWDSSRNAEWAIESGMKAKLPTLANWWIAENLDNALTGLHDQGMYRKYGYGRMVAQISVDIRENKISRERALGLVKERDGLFPWQYANVPLADVLGWLNMTAHRLMEHFDDHTNWDLFEPELVAGRAILRDA